MKILVIQPKMIGDVLISGVLFVALREKFPEAKFHFLVNENTIPVLENNKFVDEIIVIKKDQQNSIGGFISIIRKVRKENYDVVIDCYAKLTTALICKLSGAKKTISFFKSYSKYFYSTTIVRSEESISTATKALEHRFQLLEPLGIDFKVIKPKLYLTEAELEDAKKQLEEINIDFKKPIVMISVLGSSIAKTYPLEYMVTIIDKIAENNSVQLLFNYIPNQKKEVMALYNLCKLETKKTIKIDFYAKTLREFMAVASHCNAIIGNEGGATNMAKALDIPTFSIFSPYIKKKDWNMFENGTTNVSVHASDYNKKKFTKKNSTAGEIYKDFKPKLFIEKLEDYLEKNNLK
jgi:heptosyltransferase II